MIRVEKKPLLESLRLHRKYQRTHDMDIYRCYLSSFDAFLDGKIYDGRIDGLQRLITGFLILRPSASNASVFAMLEMAGVFVVESGDAE